MDSARYGLTSAKLKEFLQKKGGRASVADVPASVEELLRTLSGGIRGNRACELVDAFITHHHIQGGALDALYRCIDRHLRVGIAASAVRHMVGELSTQRKPVTRDAAFLHELQTKGHIASRPMPMALARAWDDRSTPPRTMHKWYASRKLDGVRCIAVAICANARVERVHLLSRTGKAFTPLQALSDTLRADLCACPHTPSSTFVLDGELCVLDDPSGGAEARENFARTVSAVHTRDSNAYVVYFPFDMLSLDAFTGGFSARFSERLEALQQVMSWVRLHCPATRLRVLPQVQVDDADLYAELLCRSSAWEGLILREDVPYEGRRTNALRKVRPQREAEYVVESVDVRTMRLAINGTYADRQALSSITIRHRGRSVAVGSGFRAQERVYYAAHPDEIVGHTVTITCKYGILTQTRKSQRS